MAVRIVCQTEKNINRGQHTMRLAEMMRRKALVFAKGMRPILMEVMLNSRGKQQRTHKALAEALNDIGIKSARGGLWSREAVRRLMQRLTPGFYTEFRMRYIRQLHEHNKTSGVNHLPDFWDRELKD